ncbi:MAG: hypothetical protein U9N30_09515 [Campylobacterota bacterium]|nr:hypothetical protein [Campylobacterota bacterium]
MKKAIIDQFMIAGVLLVMIIIFVATVNDEASARNKLYNLKGVINTSAYSMGSYYMFQEENTSNAEDVSDDILDQTPLGSEIKNAVTYTWDLVSEPRTVTTVINNYVQENFWYKFLDQDSFSLKATAIAQLHRGYVDNFVPIAINGCSQTFEVGDTFEYLLKSYDLYDDNDNVGFFGLYPEGGGQSSFAHLKNLVHDVMHDTDSEFTLDDEMNVSTVDSSTIANDVKQIAQSFAISGFSTTPMSIVETGCGSTADDLIITRVFKISMEGVYCGDGCFNPAINACELTDLNGGIFTAMDWDTSVSSCNSEDFFKIKFTIDEILQKEVKVVD